MKTQTVFEKKEQDSLLFFLYIFFCTNLTKGDASCIFCKANPKQIVI